MPYMVGNSGQRIVDLPPFPQLWKSETNAPRLTRAREGLLLQSSKTAFACFVCALLIPYTYYTATSFAIFTVIGMMQRCKVYKSNRAAENNLRSELSSPGANQSSSDSLLAFSTMSL